MVAGVMILYVLSDLVISICVASSAKSVPSHELDADSHSYSSIYESDTNSGESRRVWKIACVNLMSRNEESRRQRYDVQVWLYGCQHKS